MNRRQFVFSSTSAFAIAFGRGSGYGEDSPGPRQAPAQPAAPPVTRFEELRRGVGMFIGQGGTIGYLVNGDGAVAVDSQFMDTAEICVGGLKQRAPKGIAMLLNTHHHGDHTGGNRAYGVSKIVAHENCLKSHRATTEKTADQQAYATTTFTDTWSEKFGNETIEARYFGPGPYRRRRGDPLPARQRDAHGRSAVQPRPSQHRSRAGRAHRQLDHDSRDGRQARDRTTPSSSPATPRTTSSATRRRS